MKIKGVDYCYMDDVVDGVTYNPKHFVNAQKIEDRKMGDDRGGQLVTYKDPDALSRNLYVTLQAIWGKQLGLEEIVRKSGSYYFENKDGGRYSSDYIGPSATRAFQLGIDNLTVGIAIKECRTIGGHMIWPRHTANVNTSRGMHACDRIDITLLEIKDFFESNFFNRAAVCVAIRNALVCDKDWFETKFGIGVEGFKKFCDKFLLVGSFVDENYEVIQLAEINPQNQFIPEKYEAFIEKNVDAVKKRNEKLAKYISDMNKVRLFDFIEAFESNVMIELFDFQNGRIYNEEAGKLTQEILNGREVIPETAYISEKNIRVFFALEEGTKCET